MTNVEPERQIPKELEQFHAPTWRKSFTLRRYPFLFVAFVGMIFSVISTLALPLSLRLGGIGTFSILLLICYSFYVGHKRQYDKWKKLNLIRLGDATEHDLELEIDFHDTFRESAQKSIAEIQKGAKEGPDPKKIQEEAHALKGACLSLGYDELARLCERMESLSKRNETHRAYQYLPNLIRQVAEMGLLMQEYFAARVRMAKHGSKKTQ